MNDGESIKKALLSILDRGDKSPLFNQFYEVCIRFSAATLNLSKNQMVRNDLQRKNDYSVQDLACECIWRLFIPRNGRFIDFEKYFTKRFSKGIESVPSDRIKAELALLIKSRTQQGLSFVREEWGDNFFGIHKSLNTEINRANSLYRVHYYNKKKYISYNQKSEIDFNLIQIDTEFLLSELYLVKMDKYDHAKMFRAVFEILNSQTEFCKAIEEKLLLDTLIEFYSNKLNDFIESTLDPACKNVEYIENEGSLNKDLERNEND